LGQVQWGLVVDPLCNLSISDKGHFGQQASNLLRAQINKVKKPGILICVAATIS
jgi:hypothetical protein